MEDFKVLIVGGSVAGLALAHCLERLGISFDVLEQGDEISPQVGASIGILPNGALILDQLGIFDDIEKVIEPLVFARIRFPDGFSFQSEYPSIIRSRFGYPLSFLERQKFLAILYRKLQHKERVHTGQKVVSIENRKTHAVVKTACNKEYTGHLIVGADGVHSIVRSEMWRHANELAPEAISEKEKSTMRVYYACIFGISSAVSGVEDGVQLSLLDYDLTIHVFNGKEGKVFWFVIVKTDRQYTYPDRPHFDQEDGRKICEGLKSKKLDATLTFGDMWSRCDIFTITPLEEGWLSNWHFGRLVCMGDAVHKVTPNIGQGANMAIEDAAALANALWKGDLQRAMEATPALEDMLHHFSSARLASSKKICTQSELLTRLQSNDGIVKHLVARYLLPAVNDIPAGSSAALLGGSQCLQYLKLPERAQRPRSWWAVIRDLRSFFPKPHGLVTVWIGVIILWCVRGWVRDYIA